MGLLNNLLGNPDKAVLLVRKPNSIPKKETSASISADISANSALANALLQAKGVHDGDTAKQIANNNHYHYFEFQYNPSELVFNTQAGVSQTRQGAAESGINNIVRTNLPASTSLSFQVWFYDINNKDAFAADKLVLASLTNIVSAVGAFKYTYSVQKEVDGLVSLLSQHSTRMVVFIYGNIIFKGEFESCNARYTMFSPSGNPIAAQVEIQIRQASRYYVDNTMDENGDKIEDLDMYDETYWEAAINDFVGKPGKDVEVDTRPTSQKVGSLINLGT